MNHHFFARTRYKTGYANHKLVQCEREGKIGCMLTKNLTSFQKRDLEVCGLLTHHYTKHALVIRNKTTVYLTPQPQNSDGGSVGISDFSDVVSRFKFVVVV